MNIILKRRQLILATLVVALGAAVFVNWYYTGNSQLKTGDEKTQHVQNLGEAKYVNATESTQNSFEAMKFERKKQHDEALSELNKSLEAAQKNSPEAKEITESINALTKNYKIQTDIESLIKNAVKSESIVTLTEKTAQVTVTKSILNETTALKILEIITANTDIDAANVTIAENE